MFTDQREAVDVVQQALWHGEHCVPPYDNWDSSRFWGEDYHGDGTWVVYWADPGLPGVRYQWRVFEQTKAVEELENPYPELC